MPPVIDRDVVLGSVSVLMLALLLVVAGDALYAWRRQRAAHRRWGLLGIEAVAVLLAAPALWFPNQRPELAALGLLLLIWVWGAVALAGGGIWPRSRFDLALAVLLVMALVGANRSMVMELTLPKVTGLILGLALYRLTLRLMRHSGSYRIAIGLMLGLALVFSAVGIVGGLRSQKVDAMGALLASMPRYVRELPDTQYGRVSMNQLGGTLLWVVPVGVSLALASGRGTGRWRLRRGDRLAVAIATAVLLATLVMAQSRGAWAGIAAGMLCIVALLWRPGRWLVPLMVLLVVGGWSVWEREYLAPLLVEVLNTRQGIGSPLGTLTLQGRLGIWARAIDHVRAAPLTGGGLGAFRIVDGNPMAPIVFNAGMPHAHNVLLQMAFDIGLPGLVAYLAMVCAALDSCRRMLGRSSKVPRALAVGAIAALVAYHVYGLVDVVALGAKPGVLWWMLMGMIAGLRPDGSPNGSGESQGKSLSGGKPKGKPATISLPDQGSSEVESWNCENTGQS
jgi:putative inorganic carbon (HCO3(-)) transporter